MSTPYIPATGDRVTCPQAPAPWNRSRVYTVARITPRGTIVLEHDGDTWSIPLTWAYDHGITKHTDQDQEN